MVEQFSLYQIVLQHSNFPDILQIIVYRIGLSYYK